LQNLIDNINSGELNATITVVISSKEDAYGLVRAEKHNIPAEIVARKKFKTNKEFSDALTKTLERYRFDLIIMAGFIHYYRFPAKYYGKILNIHPALLPKYGGKNFYGERVHEAVLRSGDKESGCTVHFADHKYDHGPIILQRRVPILPDDTPHTLAERVFEQEKIAYVEAIKMVADGLVKPSEGGIIYS
jgi:formyltetrahydrofolate-dependent phosphoribosylglycinamide formyltransferase